MLRTILIRQVIPKPWSISHFTNLLLKVISKGSYGDRAGACSALHVLHQSKVSDHFGTNAPCFSICDVLLSLAGEVLKLKTK